MSRLHFRSQTPSTSHAPLQGATLPTSHHSSRRTGRRSVTGRGLVTLVAAAGLSMGTLSILAAAPAGAATAWTGYVTNAADGTVSAVSANGPSTSGNPITVGSGAGADPAAAAVDGNQVFVANYGDDTVGVINAASNQLVATIPVGTNPVAVAISPDGTQALVANDFDNTVSVIDTTTDAVVGSPISIPGNPEAIATGTVSGVPTAYVATSTAVYPVNLTTLAVGTSVALPNTPVGSNSVLPQARAAALTPDATTLYVADFASGEVDAINTATSAVTQIPTGADAGSEPAAIAVGTVSGTVFAYVANYGEGSVSVIQEGQTEPATTLSLGSATSGPDGIAVTPDGATVVVTEANTGLAVDISTSSTATSDAVGGSTLVGSGAGSSPAAIAVPPASATAPTLSVATTSLPAATTGVAYSAPLAALGGVGPITWSVSTGGSSLSGIGLSLSPGGRITGTPSTGTASFKVTATDAESQTATSGTLTITVSVLTITSSTTLPNGAVGSPYPATTLNAVGGAAPYTWSGTAPFGLTLNADGSITGTPATSGTTSFSVTVTDSAGTPHTSTESFSVQVKPAITLAPAALPGTAVGKSYAAATPLATFVASGGNAPFAYALSAGTLPPGLSLNSSTGAVTGLVSGSGVFPITIQVTDAAGNTVTQNYSLSAFGVTTNSLPSATVGHAYTSGSPLATLAAVGGTTPYSWTSTTLPAGLSLSAAGAITGTPTAAGSTPVTFTATDSSGTPQQASSQLTITVNGAAAIVPGSGTPQSTIVDTAFGTALSATVTDASSNPIVGAVVTFTAPGTGASGTFPGSAPTANATTNAAGIATAPALTANATIGTYGVTATTPGIANTATFTLSNTADVAAAIAATGGTPQSATVSTAFGTALSATVTDPAHAPLAGATVTFTAPGTGASGTFPGASLTANAVTNGSGVATSPVFTANGTAGGYSVTATTAGVGAGATFSLTNTSAVGPSGAPYTPLTPVRVCDTRAVSTFVPANQCDSGAGNPVGSLSAGGTKTINVANAGNGGLGTFGVPANATSVVLNVTAVNPAAPGGFMTVWPAGASQPDASNLNYPTGETVPNLVQVGVGTSGDISFASSDVSDLIVDVEGYSAPGPDPGAGLYNALTTPARLCDTRAPSSFTAANQCDGPGTAAGTLAANVAKDITVTNGGSIPSGATAAVLNVTVVNPAAAGFLTAYPQGSAAPNASNLNFGAGQTTTNRVIVPLSSSGKISVVSSAQTDALVDVSGYYSAAAGTGTEFSPESAPVRVCDTRAPSSFSPQNQCSNEHLASGTGHELNLKVTNGGAVSDGVPANATAVVVNLTGIAPSAATFLTVFPGPTLPNSSDLNPAAGETRANLVVATVNANGTISVFNNTGSLDVLVDVLGWYS
jgi:YVTN family beta-propeller protein